MVQSAPKFVLVFAPGLWPYRAPLDYVSWQLAANLATLLGTLPGVTAFATPKSLLEPAAANDPRVPIRVYRSLPPIEVVREEGEVLGADWAITGRLLIDSRGLEVWLNCLDAREGHLLWIGKQATEPSKVLFSFVSLIRKMVQKLAVDGADTITVESLCGTGSWPAFIALSNAQKLVQQWHLDEAVSIGLELLKNASRALALDSRLEDAKAILEQVGPLVVERIEKRPGIDLARDSLAGSEQNPTLMELRQLLHNRWLALAETSEQT